MTKSKTPNNKRGYFTKNHTQKLDKLHTRKIVSNKTSGMERSITETTAKAPSGEQGLPDLH